MSYSPGPACSRASQVTCPGVNQGTHRYYRDGLTMSLIVFMPQPASLSKWLGASLRGKGRSRKEIALWL